MVVFEDMVGVRLNFDEVKEFKVKYLLGILKV